MDDDQAKAEGTGDMLDLVRRLIDEAEAAPAPPAQRQPVGASVEAVAPSAAPDDAPPVSRRVVPRAQPRPAAGFDDLLSQDDCETCGEPRPGWRRRAQASARAFLARPEATRELALAFLAVSVIVWPGYVAALATLALLAAAITWLTLGPDEAAERIAAWHGRLAARDPAKAETIRRRAARVSRAIARLADRLPDHWTTGLALPDFKPPQEAPAKLKDDPFDRLAAEVHGGGGAGRGA